MAGEGARSGVKHPGPRARFARQPTPATQTILYSGLGFMEFIFLCPDACFDVFKVALLGFMLGLGVASALFGPAACRPVEALIYLKVKETLCACSWIPLL